jgi:hypothetical protein
MGSMGVDNPKISAHAAMSGASRPYSPVYTNRRSREPRWFAALKEDGTWVLGRFHNKECRMARKVADVMWEMLENAGVKRCYGIVGDALNPVIDIPPSAPPFPRRLCQSTSPS